MLRISVSSENPKFEAFMLSNYIQIYTCIQKRNKWLVQPVHVYLKLVTVISWLELQYFINPVYKTNQYKKDLMNY